VLALLGWFAYSQLGGGSKPPATPPTSSPPPTSTPPTSTPPTSTPPTSIAIQVAVPKVIGSAQKLAEQALTDAGLVPKSTQAASDKDVGTVISVSPDEGTPVDKGSDVTLIISAGPDQVQVPDVSGLKQDDAITALNKAGFPLITVRLEDTAGFKAGQAIRTDPKAKSSVPPQTSVTLYVASGEVTVTDVRGKSLDEAKKILVDLGLNVALTQESSTEPKNTVLKQDPVGVKVAIGTQINLTYAVEPTTPPAR
jgi:eukaryotic-like serine/threonine-protein kinase